MNLFPLRTWAMFLLCSCFVQVSFAQLTVTMNATAASCFGSCDGSATATATGGAAPYTYLWNDIASQTTGTASSLCVGSYIVTVTDALSDTVTGSITVTEPALMVATISAADVLCNGDCNGSASVSVTSGIAPFTFIWSNAFVGSNATSLCAGTYTVTVTDMVGCTAINSVTINQPPPIGLTITTIDASCGLSDGSASVTVSGGSGAYTYLWDDPAATTTATMINAPAGLFTVIVTDANGCTQSASATINSIGGVTVSISSSTMVTCNGGADGAAAVVVSGGTAPYTYTWNTTPTQTSSMATGLSAGTYIVTVVDAAGCISTTSVTITEPTGLTISTSAMNPTCAGTCDGGATAVAAGGVPPFTYLWDDPMTQTTATAFGFCSGVYTVIVVDVNGCQSAASVTLLGPAMLNASIISQTLAACGTCDGTANAAVTGGNPPYTYIWDDPALQTTANVTSLCTGTFVLTVTDVNGCADSSAITISGAGGYTFNIAITDPACGACDGVASSSVSGSIAPLTYAWSNGGNASFIDSICPGSYTLNVTDANGCFGDTTIAVTNSGGLATGITNSFNATCSGMCNGNATVAALGGTAPFTFLWSDGQTDSVAINLCAGTYTVTVSDVNGCQNFTGVTIGEPPALSSAITSLNDASCFGTCDGFMNVSVAGGTPPYAYVWDDPLLQTTAMAVSLCPATFTVVVTDAMGCTVQASALISQPSQLSGTITTTQATTGNCDGTATVLVTGGVSPYMYIWDDPGVQNTVTATSLCAGTYCATIMDVNGCTDTICATVTADSACIGFSVTATGADVSCNGAADGTATATVNSGTAPFTYLWSPSGQTTASISSLTAGTYLVQVTDSNGCLVNASAFITEPLPLMWTSISSDASCGICDGMISIFPSGGVLPYTYLWDVSAGSQTTAIATGLCAGTSGVTVTDANGCTTVANLFVSTNQQLSGTLTSIADAACGLCDGSASVAIIGGNGPYTYSWSNGESAQQADSLCAGNNTVMVIDSGGCTYLDSLVVNNVGGLTGVISNTNNVTCNGFNDGWLSVGASGGLPPYSYLWNDSLAQTTSTAINLGPGNYAVAITDSVGCIFTVVGTLTEPSSLVGSAVTVNNSCGTSGSASAVVSGGTPPYTYLWNTIPVQTSSSATGLLAGSYVLNYSDANGCADSLNTVILDDSVTIAINGSVSNPNYCGTWGYYFYNLTGGTAPYTITWSPQPLYWYSWNNYALLNPGNYTINVVGANGCTGSSTFTILNLCPPNYIAGVVYSDEDGDCIVDTEDYPLSNRVVTATPGPYYSVTNSLGEYSFRLDSGTYTISYVNQNTIRSLICPVAPGTYTLNLGASPDTINSLDFGLQPLVSCAAMEVDIHTGWIRPCMGSSAYVSYCNKGTDTAYNATVEVTLDNGVSYSSGGPFIGTNGSTVVFDIGTVGPEECGSFLFYFNIGCGTPLGSTKCFEAHIFPDSICEPVDSVWDRSSVEVIGLCTNDSACFSITNTGDPGAGDMQGTSEYRIYENNLLVFTGSFQLNGGASTNICWPANSNTIRLEADQRPGHPGNSHPQDNVEFCGTPSFTINQINSTPQNDIDPFVEVYCRIVTGSFDPNDKQVQPVGLLDAFHFIDSTDALDYQIRFQNTGTDTAFNIFIRDTIDPALDISSLRAGVSSHPYTIQFYDNNVVQFTFANVMLPDSNINEPESHGFIKFKINQVDGNTDGTRIENRAGIIFDFNVPVITNTVFNTIGDIDSLTISQPEIYAPNIDVKVYPNPFTTTTTFEIQTSEHLYTLRLEVYNVVGEKIKVLEHLTGSGFIFDGSDMASGIYIYQLTSQVRNNIIASGKLIVR